MIAGLVLYLVVFPDLFGPRAHEGFAWNRVVIAAAVGAGSAVIGVVVGLLIERLRR
jgi:zinc transporter ZupT